METKHPIFSAALKTGLVIGSVSIAVFLIQYVAGIKPVGIMRPILIGLFGFAVSVTLLVIYLKKYRGQSGGFISFKDAFLYGFIALLVSAAISSVFNFLFIQYFDPEYTRSIIEAQKDFMENYLSGKVPDESIQDALDGIDESMNVSTLKQSLNSLIFGSVFALIVSLIVGAVMKRKPAIFDDKNTGGVV
ncbi:DUF4199 domain-containing protein [Lentimicrobium sp.]|uniref:DUF4199 domain-containing protein n=1 Tax=Lentimicrobium sp. TaxID=2034841 RepID=UPI00345F09B9